MCARRERYSLLRHSKSWQATETEASQGTEMGFVLQNPAGLRTKLFLSKELPYTPQKTSCDLNVKHLMHELKSLSHKSTVNICNTKKLSAKHKEFKQSTMWGPKDFLLQNSNTDGFKQSINAKGFLLQKDSLPIKHWPCQYIFRTKILLSWGWVSVTFWLKRPQIKCS